jgi:hypothetical protein
VLRWDYTEGVGYCAVLPDRRFAYVQPSRRHPGMWIARIVRRPGQRVADTYSTPKPSAEECMWWVESLKASQDRRAA